MRWPRANLEEKQEPRAATSASAEPRAEGMWHDVIKKGLDLGRDREADVRDSKLEGPLWVDGTEFRWSNSPAVAKAA